MKKIKLYSIISVLIIVILFGTAAICNQCGITPTTETNVTVITQAAEITEETTTATTAKTTTATTAATTATTTATTTAATTVATTAATTADTTPPVSFTFTPKSGPGGTDVKLNLSAPVGTSATVYYNGQALPKSISADSKTFTVTIPVGASSGYFELKWDGKNVKASEKFIVTAPPQADLVITSIIPASTTGEGNIYVAIKNVGTADLNNSDIHVICHADGRLRSDLTKTQPADSDEWIKSSLPAGGNAGFHPSMVIDVSLYTYTVVYCNIILDGDPTPDNNLFSISIP